MISIISFICVALYSQDLLSYLCDRTTLITVIALILTSAVIFAEELCPLLQGAFFLNDLIAFMVAGTYVKFIVIRKIKVSIWAIILMWFFFALRQFAIQIRILNFD